MAMTPVLSKDTPITYVLVGHDRNNALKKSIEAFSAREGEMGDVRVIRVEDFPNLRDALRKIKQPGNVILAAHGGENGTFEWKKNESVRYGKMFEGIPAGVASVTVLSCYGGSAIDSAISRLPAGTLLFSMVSERTAGDGAFLAQYAKELGRDNHPLSPARLILETLDNTDPELLAHFSQNMNRIIQEDPDKARERAYIFSTIFHPSLLIPSRLGLGGTAQTVLNLRQEVTRLAERITSNQHDPAAFTEAIGLVSSTFDPHSADGFRDWQLTDGQLVHDATGVKESPEKTIHLVAERMHRGDVVDLTPQETRIAFALTIAYLHTSGDLDRLVSMAKGQTVARQEPPPAKVRCDASEPHKKTILKEVLNVTYGLPTDGRNGEHALELASILKNRPDWQGEKKYNPDYERLLAGIAEQPEVIRVYGSAKESDRNATLRTNLPTCALAKPKNSGNKKTQPVPNYR